MFFPADIAIALLHGLGLMALISLVFGTVERFPTSAFRRSLAHGVVFGLGAVGAMVSPAPFTDGIIIDARGVMVGLGAAFAGGPAAIMAAALASGYRYWIGGIGAPVGVAGIMISAAAGYFWGRYARASLDIRISDLIGLAAAISLHVLAFLFLPIADPFGFFVTMSAMLVPAYVAGVVLLGSMIRRERRMILREKALRLDAGTDPLTGLANRRVFDRKLADSLSASGAGGRGLSLLLLDIDHFKQVNDTFGHECGDEALRIVAAVLQSCLRENDLVARRGGEEFCILLPAAQTAAALRIAERIRADVEKVDMTLSGRRLKLTVSIGVASAPQNGDTPAELHAAADAAMYAAKNAGRNRVEVHAGGFCSHGESRLASAHGA